MKTDTALAETLGVAQSTLAGWKSRDSVDLPLIISKCESANLNWLLRGEGEPRYNSGFMGILEAASTFVWLEHLGRTVEEEVAPYVGADTLEKLRTSLDRLHESAEGMDREKTRLEAQVELLRDLIVEMREPRPQGFRRINLKEELGDE